MSLSKPVRPDLSLNPTPVPDKRGRKRAATPATPVASPQAAAAASASSSSSPEIESSTSIDSSCDADDDAVRSARSQTLKFIQDLSNKLKNGSCETVHMATLKPAGIKLSPLWDEFRPIRDAVTKTVQDAAVCIRCNRVLAYHERKTGTSSLSRHLTMCRQKAGVGTECNSAAFEDPPKPAKEDFKATCAAFCALGLRPPDIMTDEGLLAVVQKALDLGQAYAHYGRLNARKLMPCPTTIKKAITEAAGKARQEVAKEVLPAITEWRCAATTDCYTDDHKKEKYLALTLHYLQDWILCNRLLFVAALEESCTAKNLEEAMKKNFELSGIHPDLMNRIRFVTDAGSDIKKALEAYDWFYCFAHALNIVLKTALGVKYATLIEKMLEDFPVATELIERANNWVREVRKRLPPNSPIKSKLKCSNPQSQGHMSALLSVERHQAQVKRALGDRASDGEVHVPPLISDQMGELADFLSPFDLDGKRESAAFISTSRYPSLLKHLEPRDDDSTMIRGLKDTVAAKRLLGPLKLLTVIESCKDLVGYLKRSGISQKLEHTVKQEVATRWNSIMDMLVSVELEWENIASKVEAKAGREKVQAVEIELVRTLIAFLAPFAAHTDKLQGQNYPTLPYAVLAFESLLQHCSPKTDDLPEIAAVRRQAYQLLCEKVLVKEDHKVATFLWPRLKHLSACSTQDGREEVYAAVRRRLQVNADRDRPSQSGTSTSSPTPAVATSEGTEEEDAEDIVSPPAKRCRYQKLDDEELYGAFMANKNESTIDEVERYLKMEPCDVGDDSNVLEWWKVQGSARFPGLARVAEQVFALPASSAPSERTFSDLTNLLDDKRTSMLPATVSDTLVFRDYLRVKLQKTGCL